MEGASAFNIGFRCENICLALKKYEGSNDISVSEIQDSLQIITDSLNLEKKVIESFSSSKSDPSELYPLIFKVFPKQGISQIIGSLREIYSALEKIARGEQNIDVTKVYKYFDALAETCLASHSNLNVTYSSTLF